MHVERHRGSAADFHGRDVPDDGGVHVWWFDVSAPAVALGSRQGPELLDHDAVRRAGVEVVRRRSGGGAVLLVPGEVVWVDVVVPVALLPTGLDLRAAMVWMGEIWLQGLLALGADAERLAVHHGGMVCTPWSSAICFAGIGPGELVLDGRKLVGLSQRRTRAAARFQCAVHRSVELAAILPLLAGEQPAVAALPPVAVLSEAVVASDADLAAALERALADALP